MTPGFPAQMGERERMKMCVCVSGCVSVCVHMCKEPCVITCFFLDISVLVVSSASFSCRSHKSILYWLNRKRKFIGFHN